MGEPTQRGYFASLHLDEIAVAILLELLFRYLTKSRAGTAQLLNVDPCTAGGSTLMLVRHSETCEYLHNSRVLGAELDCLRPAQCQLGHQ